MRQPCYVIAEIGVNHNGSLDLAREMIDAAVDAKADAVKFQTFKAEDLVTASAQKADYQRTNTQNNDSQFSMLKSLELSAHDFEILAQYCQSKEIEFLSTPFSIHAVDLLSEIGVDRYKVSSGDLTYLGLLSHIARKGKPVILSTGMGTLSEVEAAVSAIVASGNTQLSLLHCVSNYPADPKDCNLAAIDTMSQAFQLSVGWSDHSMGSAISWAAVARGATIIEKHITTDQSLPGPDQKASMEPTEFKSFVDGIRMIESAIGTGIKRPTEAEKRTALAGRRSITSSRALTRGTVLTDDDIKIVRPGTGLAPGHLPLILGCSLTRDIDADTPITTEDIHGK